LLLEYCGEREKGVLSGQIKRLSQGSHTIMKLLLFSMIQQQKDLEEVLWTEIGKINLLVCLFIYFYF
jgi:hypothetical protein